MYEECTCVLFDLVSTKSEGFRGRMGHYETVTRSNEVLRGRCVGRSNESNMVFIICGIFYYEVLVVKHFIFVIDNTVGYLLGMEMTTPLEVYHMKKIRPILSTPVGSGESDIIPKSGIMQDFSAVETYNLIIMGCNGEEPIMVVDVTKILGSNIIFFYDEIFFKNIWNIYHISLKCLKCMSVLFVYVKS